MNVSLRDMKYFVRPDSFAASLSEFSTIIQVKALNNILVLISMQPQSCNSDRSANFQNEHYVSNCFVYSIKVWKESSPSK